MKSLPTDWTAVLQRDRYLLRPLPWVGTHSLFWPVFQTRQNPCYKLLQNQCVSLFIRTKVSCWMLQCAGTLVTFLSPFLWFGLPNEHECVADCHDCVNCHSSGHRPRVWHAVQQRDSHQRWNGHSTVCHRLSRQIQSKHRRVRSEVERWHEPVPIVPLYSKNIRH